MKKIFCLILSLSVTISFCVMLSSCGEKDYSNYKSEEGYEEYISYSDKGSKYANYFSIPESIVENEKAFEYYNNNIRKCGDFMVTDYLDGVCINDFIATADESNGDDGEIIIPETLDGKKVIAIGAYCYNKMGSTEEDVYNKFRGAFDSEGVGFDLKLVLPSGLKYIGCLSTDQTGTDYVIEGCIEFSVDENNPYYKSKDGNLYTKDMKTLLYLSDKTRPNISVSDKTEIFAPINGVFGNWAETITLGKNIGLIDSAYYYEESDAYTACPFTVKGYRGTAAEKWAAENEINFEPLG